MLRPPTEVVGSKQKYYANRLGSAHLAASWVNMLLHTERATREPVATAAASSSATTTSSTTGSRSPCRSASASTSSTSCTPTSEQIREVHRFIDPSLRRVTSSLDDLELPPRLHELTDETWAELNKLADEGGDTAEVHATLDQLREAYVDLYDEAEAISRSLGRRRQHGRASARVRRRRPPRRPPSPGDLADRIPHGVRADRSRPAVRRGVRKGARARTMTRPPGSAGRAAATSRGTPTSTSSGRGPSPSGLRPGTTAVLRVKNEAPSLPWVLPPLLRACDHVLLVDNGSDDGTAEVARPGRRERGLARPAHAARTPSRSPAPAPSTSPSPSGRCTRWPTSTTGASPTSAPATP